MLAVNRLIWLAMLSLSNLEAYLSQPNDKVPLRRFFLKISRIEYGGGLWIGHSLWIAKQGNIRLGKRVGIGECSRICNYEQVTIGDDFIAAGTLVINTGTHDPLSMETFCMPVTVGNRVWCGERVTILAGVNIGDDVVIGAGALVNRDIPSNTIAAGVPARIIRSIPKRLQIGNGSESIVE